MIFPASFIIRLASRMAWARLRGNRHLPHVLMLEPTFRCNLACAGCGRLRENERVGGRMLTAAECADAAAQCGAPSVCLTGGEPLLHPEIGQIVRNMLRSHVYTHLATNGILLEESLGTFAPHPYFTFVLHIDGLEKRHDSSTGRPGSFRKTVEAIRAGKAAGFSMKINLTIYKGMTTAELLEVLGYFAALGIDGIMLSPAFNYEREGDGFSSSPEEVHALFRSFIDRAHSFPLCNTPPYLEFLAGRRVLRCKPWSTPTRDPRGWKSPCYLIGDKYYGSFNELITSTPWARYGKGNDPRCERCMMHSGFEGGALDAVAGDLGALVGLARWAMRRGVARR